MTVDPAVRRAGELFAHQTGTGTPEMIAAATAWAYHEGGNVVRYNNPWNLHGVKGNYGGLAIGDWYAGSGDVHVAKFATLEDGVAAAVMNLRAHGSDFAHYDKVLAAAKKGDGLAFLDALARSAWSGGRYGGPDHNALVPLYRQILPTVTTTPTPPPAPPTEEPPVKPSALQTQPLLALGGLGTVLSAVLVFAVDQKYVTSDQGNVLVQVAAVALPLVLAAIGRQFVTPNVTATAKVEEAKVTAQPAVVSDADLSLPAGYDAELWNAIISRSMASHDGKEPPRHEVLATYQKDVRNGALDKPAPVVPPPPPVVVPTVPYEPGPAPATDVSDASPEGSLTGPEYSALVLLTKTPVDFVAQCRAWMTANLGKPLYLELLYVRLNVYCNAYKAGNKAAGIVAAIREIQVELYRAEQISTGTGVGPVDRQVPFNRLVQGEGSYVAAPADLQAILMGAKPADALMANDAGVIA